MKNAFLVIIEILILMLPALNATAQDATSCVTIPNREQGTRCGNRNSQVAYFQNGCTIPIEVKYCLQRSTGKSDCGMATLRAGEATSGYVCDGTGKYWYQARMPNTNVRFVPDAVIPWDRR